MYFTKLGFQVNGDGVQRLANIVVPTRICEIIDVAGGRVGEEQMKQGTIGRMW